MPTATATKGDEAPEQTNPSPEATDQTSPDASATPTEGSTAGEGTTQAPADAKKAPKAPPTRLKVQATVPLDLKDPFEAALKEKGLTMVTWVKEQVYAFLGQTMPESERVSTTKQKYSSKEEAAQAQRNRARSKAREAAEALAFYHAIKEGKSMEEAQSYVSEQMVIWDQERDKADAKAAEEAAKKAAEASSTPAPADGSAPASNQAPAETPAAA